MNVLLLLLIFIRTANFANIGFFCNGGGYSHDAYSDYLAKNMISHGDHNVSIIQIRVFEYYKEVPFSQNFQSHILHDFVHDEKSNETLQKLQELMWEMFLPYDLANGSFIGIRSYMNIRENYVRGCLAALSNRTFFNAIRNQNLNLAVIDDENNDCANTIAKVLNISVAYIFSSPFRSTFDYTGAPSNPTYVPVFFCNYEPYKDFFGRFLNVVGYIFIINIGIVVDYLDNSLADFFYKWINLLSKPSKPLETKALLLATSWEMFLDMARPMARNMRYFGCESCGASVDSTAKDKLSLMNLEESTGVILVSFGTFVEAKKIPKATLQNFVKALSYFRHYVFIWQLDMSTQYFQEKILNPINFTMPTHVKLYRWIPLMQLLNHPKVLLLITHAGATTAKEAAYSGTPVLGIPIVFDQYSNAQRLAHRGVGETITAIEVNEYFLFAELTVILGNYAKYKGKAMRLRSMLNDYRNLEKTSSSFWINFIVRQFGKKENKSNQKVQKFWTSHHSNSWMIYFSFDIIFLAMCLFVCTFVLSVC